MTLTTMIRRMEDCPDMRRHKRAQNHLRKALQQSRKRHARLAPPPPADVHKLASKCLRIARQHRRSVARRRAAAIARQG